MLLPIASLAARVLSCQRSSEDFLQDGEMTVEGLVSFYKAASVTRPSAVIDNLKTLKLLFPKAIGVITVADAIKNSRALVKFTFDVGYSDSKKVTIESSMTEADFSGKKLYASGAIMLASFLPKCR